MCFPQKQGGGFLFPTNCEFGTIFAKFLFILEEPILNILWHLKVRMKADDIYFTFKKNSFKRFHRRYWKIFEFFFSKIQNFYFSIFAKISIVLPTSKYKKWIFWIILSISCPRNFFHRTFSFFSKRAWKSSKISKLDFLKKSAFFEKIQFWGFSSPFREKN